MGIGRFQTRGKPLLRMGRLDLRTDGNVAAGVYDWYRLRRSQNRLSTNNVPFLVTRHDTNIGSGLCHLSAAETPLGQAALQDASNILCRQISTRFTLR